VDKEPVPAADPIGAVALPALAGVGARNHALSGAKPRLSANTLTVWGDPTVVTNHLG